MNSAVIEFLTPETLTATLADQVGVDMEVSESPDLVVVETTQAARPATARPVLPLNEYLIGRIVATVAALTVTGTTVPFRAIAASLGAEMDYLRPALKLALKRGVLTLHGAKKGSTYSLAVGA